MLVVGDNRLLDIKDSTGRKFRADEVRGMAEELLIRRKQSFKWDGNSKPAGHGNDDSDLNPCHSK